MAEPKGVGGGKSVNKITAQQRRINQTISTQMAAARAAGDTARYQQLQRRMLAANNVARSYVANIRRASNYQTGVAREVRNATRQAQRSGQQTTARLDAARRSRARANTYSYGRDTYRGVGRGNRRVGGQGQFRPIGSVQSPRRTAAIRRSAERARRQALNALARARRTLNTVR